MRLRTTTKTEREVLNHLRAHNRNVKLTKGMAFDLLKQHYQYLVPKVEDAHFLAGLWALNKLNPNFNEVLTFKPKP